MAVEGSHKPTKSSYPRFSTAKSSPHCGRGHCSSRALVTKSELQSQECIVYDLRGQEIDLDLLRNWWSIFSHFRSNAVSFHSHSCPSSRASIILRSKTLLGITFATEGSFVNSISCPTRFLDSFRGPHAYSRQTNEPRSEAFMYQANLN